MQPQRRLSDAVAAACRDVTPQKRGHAAKTLDEVLPQKWRQPAAMVAAVTALLLLAPMFWAHSSDAAPSVVPATTVARRHLQQPSRTSGASVVGDLKSTPMPLLTWSPNALPVCSLACASCRGRCFEGEGIARGAHSCRPA